MDAFFASVEQAVNPRLRGKPLIVGGRADRRRTVVCAASYEAKRLGIDSGMSAHGAFRICPYAEFVTADSAKYIYISSRIAQLLQRYSPQVEQASVDEFYLDVSGEDKRFGSYLELGMDIKQTIKRHFGITGSIGISINRLMSKIASKLEKPDGMVIIEENDIQRVLRDLPVQKIPGIGARLTEHLNKLSIFTFSDMQNVPEKFLVQRFGKIGQWMYAVAHPEIAQEEQIHYCNKEKLLPKSVGHSYTLPNDIYARPEIEGWLRLLCEMVGVRLRRHKLESSILHVYVRKPNFECISREKNFKDYTNDSGMLYQRAIFIMDTLKVRNTAVRALGVTARNVSPAAGTFLFHDQKKRDQMLNAQDRINERFGDWTVYPASIFGIR